MLPRAKEIYLSIDPDGWLHFYAAKSWRNVFNFLLRMAVIFYVAKRWRHVFIICSGWLSFLCWQDLKTCIYNLLRMVVILMLSRAEETSYLFRMVVIFKLSKVFLDKYLRLNSSPWLIRLSNSEAIYYKSLQFHTTNQCKYHLLIKCISIFEPM